MSEQKVHWLTQNAYDRLTEELTERTEVTRAKITKAIEIAREEGDLRENGGYHAAKDDQGRNEARIKELKHLLQHAQVGRPDDVTRAVMFFADPANSFVTGQTLYVCGGASVGTLTI